VTRGPKFGGSSSSFVKLVAHHTAFLLCATVVSFALCGCVGLRLKKVELAQLEVERATVKSTAETLINIPPISYAVISGETTNQFLSRLDGYKIALDHPKGAIATIDSARINFKDGMAQALVEAEATDRNHLVRVKLRVAAGITVAAADGAVHLRFVPLEILPLVKVSIFRWHELWFVASLLRIKANDYTQSMPDVIIPIKTMTPLDVDAPTEVELSIGQAGSLPARVVFPDRHLLYVLSVEDAVILHDGIHVFLALDRTN
jgi:hypothetical protein